MPVYSILIILVHLTFEAQAYHIFVLVNTVFLLCILLFIGKTAHLYYYYHFIDCRQTISNCTDCTSDLETDETLCSQCHEGFTLSIDNRRCDGRSNVELSCLMDSSSLLI